MICPCAPLCEVGSPLPFSRVLRSERLCHPRLWLWGDLTLVVWTCGQPLSWQPSHLSPACTQSPLIHVGDPCCPLLSKGFICCFCTMLSNIIVCAVSAEGLLQFLITPSRWGTTPLFPSHAGPRELLWLSRVHLTKYTPQTLALATFLNRTLPRKLGKASSSECTRKVAFRHDKAWSSMSFSSFFFFF